MPEKETQNAEGLGDTVASLIHRLTGITPCEGCKRRAAWLNKRFPYRKGNDGMTGKRNDGKGSATGDRIPDL